MNDREVKLLVFDMGHVLIDFEWVSVCRQFATAAGVSLEEFQVVLSRVGTMGYEIGRVDTREFLCRLNELLGTEIGVAEFTRMWNHEFRENIEMSDLLTRLKGSYPLYLLSNTNENHYGFIQERFDVERHFDELILSHLVECAKPDPAIYEHVMERSGLSPSECLFVDDLEDNVRAARTVGMHAILFRGHGDLIEQFTRYGIEVASV
ncbi:MAG: HAD family phosphatase [Candidatus Melainabacteria bacterium]|nr:HAD family phosphatase [Candidatus Melainabacteria bacterium]